MDLNNWANISIITGGGVTLIGGLWTVVVMFIIKPLKEELQNMSLKVIENLDDTYVRKEKYESDRQLMMDTLKGIRTDICQSINILTNRIDNVYTHIVEKHD